MQRLLLLYDIVSDRARSKVADACLDYGLDRIQYSAFVGCLSRTLQQELMYRIEDILDGGTANVKLIAIPDRDWNNRLEIDCIADEEEEEEEPF
jgi:CRISPR-associated protein Cas2